MVAQFLPLLKKTNRKYLYKNNLYISKVAESDEEKKEVYRLRYRVFHDELNELPANKEKQDVDEFDKHCDHLILKEAESGKIIGTYRILPWTKVPEKGYYSEQEFEFKKMPGKNCAELGRLCIDKDFRETNSFISLWLGLYRYSKVNKVRYFFGVTSLHKNTSKEDLEKIYSYLKKHKRISSDFIAVPLNPADLTKVRSPSKKQFKKMVPKMVKNYLRIGTFFIGEPSYDEVFEVYDILTIFDIKTLRIKSINSILTLKNYLKSKLSDS